MRGARIEERGSPRSTLLLSGAVRCTNGSSEEHIAFTRDLSSSGLFFYSDFPPRLSDDLTLTLVTADGACLLLQGRVVRVEQHVPSSAVGIALILYTHLLAA